MRNVKKCSFAILVLALILVAAVPLVAAANDQCQDLELKYFFQASGYGPDRYTFVVFNHENYGEPAPTGASIAVFFELQDPNNPVTIQGIWPPQPQSQGSYVLFVPGAANHKLTATISCRRF